MTEQASLNGKWVVAAVQGVLPNGNRRWLILSEHDAHADALRELDRARAEGFHANIAHIQVAGEAADAPDPALTEEDAGQIAVELVTRRLTGNGR